jgi:hypothetical protein
MEHEIHKKCHLGETEAADGERVMGPEIHEERNLDETEAMNGTSAMESEFLENCQLDEGVNGGMLVSHGAR